MANRKEFTRADLRFAEKFGYKRGEIAAFKECLKILAQHVRIIPAKSAENKTRNRRKRSSK